MCICGANTYLRDPSPPPPPTRLISQQPQSSGVAIESRRHTQHFPASQEPNSTLVSAYPVPSDESIPTRIPSSGVAIESHRHIHHFPPPQRPDSTLVPAYPVPSDGFITAHIPSQIPLIRSAGSKIPPISRSTSMSPYDGARAVSEGRSSRKPPLDSFRPTITPISSRAPETTSMPGARTGGSERRAYRKLPLDSFRPTVTPISSRVPETTSTSGVRTGGPERGTSRKPSLKSKRSIFAPISRSLYRSASAPARIGDYSVSEGEPPWKPLPESSRSNPLSFPRPMSRSYSDNTHRNARYRAPRAPPLSFGRGGYVDMDLDSRAGPRADPKRAVATGYNTRSFLLPTVREVLPEDFRYVLRPRIVINNHQIYCRFRILVVGKVRADGMAHFAIKLTPTIITASVWKIFTHQRRLQC